MDYDRIEALKKVLSSLAQYFDQHDIEYVSDTTNLESHKKLSPLEKLITSTISSVSGEVAFKFFITYESWSLSPVTKYRSSSDYGSNLTSQMLSPDTIHETIQTITETLDYVRSGSGYLVVHSKDSNELVQLLYVGNAEGSYDLVCCRFPFSLQFPIRSENSRLFLDLACDEVNSYEIGSHASSISIGKYAARNLHEADTKSTIKCPMRIENTDDLEPIHQSIEILV